MGLRGDMGPDASTSFGSGTRRADGLGREEDEGRDANPAFGIRSAGSGPADGGRGKAMSSDVKPTIVASDGLLDPPGCACAITTRVGVWILTARATSAT